LVRRTWLAGGAVTDTAVPKSLNVTSCLNVTGAPLGATDGQLHQARLHQILGLGRGSGQQRRHPPVMFAARPHERVEALL
jgi:hypothetical protein